ncbi:MAG: ISKra4 family transposase [Chloroflexota bacterium]|nr:ISKra4 family transposase [Chloroflexota bacterium]
MSRKSTPERDALIADLLEKMRRQLQEQLPDEQATLDQIEEAAGKIARQISQDIQRRLVAQRGTKQPCVPKPECICGATLRYKGQQARSIVTVHGVLTYKRACYHCAACQHTLAPLDQDLGLDSGTTSTQVRLWVALLAGQLPFAQAATTLQILTQVALSAASVERLSVAIGTALRKHQQQQAKQHQGGTLPEPTRPHRPQRLYIGLDGVFVPLRDAWKKDKSQGALTCRYGECKSGVVYEAHQDQHGKDSRVRTRAYVATLGNVDTFAPLLGALAHQHGHHAAKEVVVIGDGAPWIWQLAAKQFHGAVQIVDFFHAAQHLAALAEARFGKDSPQSREWLAARQEELRTNGLDKVLCDIRAWRPTNPSKRQLRLSTYAFLCNNAQRMRYQTFLEKGYHIGSGVVEATCKHVVAQRLDQVGMHWRPESAEAIVALRAAQLSTCPPDLRPHCALRALPA